MVWLPVFGIFNVRRCWCKQLNTGAARTPQESLHRLKKEEEEEEEEVEEEEEEEEEEKVEEWAEKIIITFYKCIIANSSAIWHQVAHTTYY